METTAELRVKMTIGDLIFQVELLRDQVTKLSAELEAEKAKNASQSDTTDQA
jgi:hypothetical protein